MRTIVRLFGDVSSIDRSADSHRYLNVLSHFNKHVPKEIPSPDDELQYSQPTGERKSISVVKPISMPGIAAEVPIVGFSATFYRHDTLALRIVYETVAMDISITDMIKDGWYVGLATRKHC